MRRVVIGAILSCVAWLAAPRAFAQSIAEARRLYLEAEFQEAIAAFEAVIARPSATVDEIGEAHTYLATLRALAGAADRARAHAAAATALDPTATAPAGAPPEVATTFDRARAEHGGRRVAIAIEPVGRVVTGSEVRVRARVEPAPPALGLRVSLRCVSGRGDPAEARGAPPEVEVHVRAAAEGVHCRASATTASGAVVVARREDLGARAGGSTREGILPRVSGRAGAGGAAGGADADDRGGASAWPWVIGVSSAALVVAGVVTVIAIASSGSDDATFSPTEIEGWR